MAVIRKGIDKVFRSVRNRYRSAEVYIRHRFGLAETEDKLIRDSQEHWNPSCKERLRSEAHWRAGEVFGGDEKWLAIGREHIVLFEQFARAIELRRPMDRIIEWGCGGGANAVQFAPLAGEFIGVDIAQATLDECARQLATIQGSKFTPILIDAADPESACKKIAGECDLFLSTYVFELLPTPEYGLRILQIAHNLLRTGGLAMIQIKYRTISRGTAPRRWGYSRNLASNTTYAIDEFWLAAQRIGFKPKLISLLPEQPLVHDGRYAYVALQK